jgi:hypothetical protein
LGKIKRTKSENRFGIALFKRQVDRWALGARAVAKKLQHWLVDTDFAGVRGERALAGLPRAERSDWRQLWKEVEALRQRAARPPDKAAAPRP